ncbi:MAG: hypothetical protein ACKOJ7_03590 [Betaproteobacteria bacterium]
MPYGYRAPTHHMRFVMERVLHAPQSWGACPGLSELDIHTAEAVLDEAAHFASGVLLPLNARGDQQGCVLSADGQVRTPDGFAQLLAQTPEDTQARARLERMRYGVQWLLPQAQVHWQALQTARAVPLEVG